MSTYPSEFVPDGPQSPQTLVQTEPPRSTVGGEASRLAGSAADAGQRVGRTAREETRKVAAEAGTQTRNLLQEAGGELREQAAVQQERLAGGLRSLGSQLSEMADGTGEPGMAADLARQGGARARAVAQWLEDREPGSLVQEVKTFARQRPGAFLGIAVGVGVLAGRLTRALAIPSESGDAAPDGSRMGDSHDR